MHVHAPEQQLYHELRPTSCWLRLFWYTLLLITTIDQPSVAAFSNIVDKKIDCCLFKPSNLLSHQVSWGKDKKRIGHIKATYLLCLDLSCSFALICGYRLNCLTFLYTELIIFSSSRFGLFTTTFRFNGFFIFGVKRFLPKVIVLIYRIVWTYGDEHIHTRRQNARSTKPPTADDNFRYDGTSLHTRVSPLDFYLFASFSSMNWVSSIC